VPELVGEGERDPETHGARSAADGLVAMAEALLESVSAETSPAAAERFQLVLHTSAAELAKPDTATDDGPGSQVQGAAGRSWRVAPSTARRLSCDCPASTMVDGPDGAALHLGRRTRRIKGRVRRAVVHRDKGMCRAPGCTDRATQIHHLWHWAMGGPTCLRNLISLCDHHHWLVHEGGFALAVRGPGQWVLISPDGVRVGPHPEPQQPAEPLPVDPDVAADAVTGHWDGSRLDPNPIVTMVQRTHSTSENVSAETLADCTERLDAEDENVSAETSAHRTDHPGEDDEVDYSLIRIIT